MTVSKLKNDYLSCTRIDNYHRGLVRRINIEDRIFIRDRRGLRIGWKNDKSSDR